MARASAGFSILAFLALLCVICFMVEAKPAALIVFGDSYADTGNHNASDPALNTPWKAPYGKTWPGRPSGRYSDGRVLTDYVASYVGLPSPVPYRIVRIRPTPQIAAGINFAFGGSGVFPTFGSDYPNISVQISQFRETIASGLFSKELLAASLALFVVAGNDYTAYRFQHPNNEGITKFIPMVVTEMAVSLQALHDLGMRTFVVTNLEPFGCFPAVTAQTNYTTCNTLQNALTGLHNKLLGMRISQLKKKLPTARFTMLDLQGAFTAALQKKLRWQSCCEAIGSGGGCGEDDSQGRPLYTVCSSSQRSFFWDSVHPTQAGWEAVTNIVFAR